MAIKSLVGQLLTFTIIKCDAGSIGGHTIPSVAMLAKVADMVRNFEWVVDCLVTNTGDDIAIIVTHQLGVNSATVHQDCRKAFEAAAEVAKDEGLYGAGQDLFPTAPSGNVRGTGPGVAEISFEHLSERRPAESIALIAADKCGPGAFNLPLFHSFADPRTCSGFLLAPVFSEGFTFVIEDMNHKAKKGRPTHRQIRLKAPEQNRQILALLRQIDRYAVAQIISGAYPEEVAVAVSTDRLHNITGKYQGKDDPVMIVRNQKIFPALEEITDGFRLTPLVTGDARGSHTMPLTPMPMNSPVDGSYCQPIVTCIATSVSPAGLFSNNIADVFGGLPWNKYRDQANEIAAYMASQRPFGVSMASQEEISYTGLQELQDELDGGFEEVLEVTNE